jgi:hypothetical protein
MTAQEAEQAEEFMTSRAFASCRLFGCVWCKMQGAYYVHDNFDGAAIPTSRRIRTV